MPTRADMAAEVTYMLGNRTDLLAQAKLWIDRAYADVQTIRPFRQTQASATIATSAGVIDYVLMSDFYAIWSVKNSTRNERIRQMSIASLDNLPAVSNAAPRRYALHGDHIFFYPTPDAVYSILYRYRKTLPVLTDSDNHLLPLPWTQPIVFRAAGYGFDYLNEHERAVMARRAAVDAIRLIQDPLAEDMADRNEPIAPVGLQTGVV